MSGVRGSCGRCEREGVGRVWVSGVREGCGKCEREVVG